MGPDLDNVLDALQEAIESAESAHPNLTEKLLYDICSQTRATRLLCDMAGFLYRGVLTPVRCERLTDLMRRAEAVVPEDHEYYRKIAARRQKVEEVCKSAQGVREKARQRQEMAGKAT